MLLFCGRGYYLLLKQRNLAIEHAEVYTVWFFYKLLRFFHIIKQTNFGYLRHVVDCLSVGRFVHELVKSILDIFMLKLLAFRGVVCNVACSIWQGFDADSTVHINQFIPLSR